MSKSIYANMQKEASILDSLFLTIEINCKKLSNVRIWTPKLPKIKENGKIIRYWPSPKDWNLGEEHYGVIRGLKIPVKNLFCHRYPLPYAEYRSLKESLPNNILKYRRFKILRNYFSILRLHNLMKNHHENISLTLDYRPDFTNVQQLPTSTQDWAHLTKLTQNDDIILRFEVGEFKTKVRSYQFPLLLEYLHLDSNIPIAAEVRRPKNTSFKRRNCILQKDKASYQTISDQSYHNFLQMVENHDLFQKCVANFEDHLKHAY